MKSLLIVVDNCSVNDSAEVHSFECSHIALLQVASAQSVPSIAVHLSGSSKSTVVLSVLAMAPLHLHGPVCPLSVG